MNNELMSTNTTNTIESREVAEMIGMQHKNLLLKIRNYIKILDSSKLSSPQNQSANAKLRSLDFFIPSEYVNSQNKKQPAFLLTKQGCEMVANKLTGEKGVLFTAKYVERFNEMEKQTINTNLSPQLQVLIAHEERMNNIENELQELRDKVDTISPSQIDTLSRHVSKAATRINKEMPITKVDRKFVMFMIRSSVLFAVNARFYREVKTKDFRKALQLIDNFEFKKDMVRIMMFKNGDATYGYDDPEYDEVKRKLGFIE